ncbi:MAG: hypothetical protein ACLFTK_08990 [Anaerolineales bacterium]
MKAITRYVAQQALEEGRQRFNASLFRSHVHVFKIQDPNTVFIRASRCRIIVAYHPLDQVELHAHLYNAFGLQFVTEQDADGVYIVALRRRLVGRFSRAEFMLRVPRYANLIFNLSPGAVLLDEFQGRLTLPPLPAETNGLPHLAEGR